MALSVENVSLKYGELRVLDNVTFEVNEQEFVCLTGPSGCGKTTLLKIIAGLITPDSGRVLLYGRPPSVEHGEIGFVFQEDALFPWLTVKKNIAFGLEIQKVPREEINKKVEAYLELVGLKSFGNYYPQQLSGGMRQRAGLARALAYGPKVLLMDEPFSSLDAQTRNELQKELLRIWSKEQKTVVMVTHSIDEAVFLADRVVVLTRRPGRLKADVPIEMPRPRERTEPQFNKIRQQLLKMIEPELREVGGNKEAY
ncbi:MAG: sulfonate transport system ATP-binding protein [Clostridia bacterium]|nr:sulfonate transport system ATP-binding protein [Clostridia bacterium]